MPASFPRGAPSSDGPAPTGRRVIRHQATVHPTPISSNLRTSPVVEISTTGWRAIDNPPVRFRRAAGMQQLPSSVSGGSIEPLRSFLNVKTDADFVLVIAWVLAALRNRGPAIQRSCCRASRGQRSPHSQQSCGDARSEHRALAPRRARVVTCSSPPITAMSSRSIMCRAYLRGFLTRSAGLRLAAASPSVSSTPTKMKCCSTP
jgi:hypothetical protein